jgi:hypothetical protein
MLVLLHVAVQLYLSATNSTGSVKLSRRHGGAASWRVLFLCFQAEAFAFVAWYVCCMGFVYCLICLARSNTPSRLHLGLIHARDRVCRHMIPLIK